jgi:hypothetical protein
MTGRSKDNRGGAAHVDIADANRRKSTQPRRESGAVAPDSMPSIRVHFSPELDALIHQAAAG